MVDSTDYETFKESIEALSVITYQMTERLYAALGDQATDEPQTAEAEAANGLNQASEANEDKK